MSVRAAFSSPVEFFYIIPYHRWNREWLQEPDGMEVLCFVLLTNRASSAIITDQLGVVGH
jgi:hypothetical protein